MLTLLIWMPSHCMAVLRVIHSFPIIYLVQLWTSLKSLVSSAFLVKSAKYQLFFLSSPNSLSNFCINNYILFKQLWQLLYDIITNVKGNPSHVKLIAEISQDRVRNTWWDRKLVTQPDNTGHKYAWSPAGQGCWVQTVTCADWWERKNPWFIADLKMRQN